MKKRTGYVSNSSSSSFILESPELKKLFDDAGLHNVRIYSCKEIKKTMISAMKYLFDTLIADPDYKYDEYDFWEEHLEGKLPDWFQYYYPIDDFKENINFLRELKDHQYITEKLDRDDLYERFGDCNCLGVDGINFLEGDL